MQRKLAAISPLALLTLAACGGGGGGSVTVGAGGSNSFAAVSPKIVKGPLQNAFVFLDYDGDGEHDVGEPSGTTNASGELASALTPTQDYRIVATTDATTTDVYSGKVISGVTLSAPNGAEVVTPLTTLLGDDVSDTEVATATTKIATALGLTIPNGQTLLDYDPFDTSSPANAATQLAYEKATTQVLNVIEKMVELAPTEDGVLDKAAKAVYDYLSVQTVAVDLTSAANGGALDTIGASFNTLTDADVSATLAAKVAELAAANTTVAAATSASDLKSAGNILELKAGSVTVSEMLENLSAGAEVGTLTPLSTYTVDASTYEILSGDHSDKFEIDGSTLKVKAGASFEAVAGSTSEITLDIKVTDASGKVHVSSIVLDVLDVSTHIELTADSAAVTNFLENVAAGSEIGVLTPAGTNTVDASTYEILPGTGADKFDITVTDSVAKLVVATGATFEAQDLGEITLNIKVDDTSGEAHVTQITLNVLDVAEFDGAVVKGPLEDALVFIDLNDNGVWDEGVDSEQVRTDATGAFSVDVYIPDGVTPEIVAVSDGTARDASSGEYLSDGAMLSAPEGASVVTPMTTLVAAADLSAADVAAALGLPDGVDPLTYNPYASDVDAASALQVEKAAHQVMNTISALKVAGEEAGLTADAALTKSLNAFTTVIVAAKEADSEVNLNDSTDNSGYGLGALTDSFVTELASSSADDFEAPPEGADEAALAAALQEKVDAAKTKVNFVKESVIQGVATVNDLVASVPEGTALTLEGTREFFSVGNKLAEQVASAVADGNVDAITVKNPSIAKAVGSNTAATKIELKSQGDAVTSIDENPSAGDVVGLLSADDTGNLTYSIVGGGAGNNFDILVDSDGAKLVVADGAKIDHETASEISFKVKVSDSLGKSHIETFTLAVGDVEEDPSISITEVSVDQGEILNQVLNASDPEGKDVTLALSSPSELFDVQEGALVSTRALTQADVDGGAQTLTIMMTDTGSSKTVAHEIVVDIKNVNDVPVFVTSSLSDATEGASYSQTLKATDADGDTPSFKIIEGPQWLSISGNTLSGTVPSDDSKISAPATIKIGVQDANGGQAVQNFSLNFINVNDAPQFYFESLDAVVLEAPDDFGVVAAQDSDNVSGTLNVLDPDSSAADISVSLTGGVQRADGTFAKVGAYGTLSFDPSTSQYLYTPNEAKIEPLFNETKTETFKFMVTDGELSDSLTLNVKITGANDKPRVADQAEQNFADLGDGQTDTIIGDVTVLDGSQNAGFVLASSGSGNDNQYFDINSDGLLVLKSGVKSEDLAQGDLLVEVFAQDFERILAEVEADSTGTGTITLGSAITGSQTFADAGIADGETVSYTISDGTDFETGTGTYTASGTTLSRTVVSSSNTDSTAPLDLSADAIVKIDFLKELTGTKAATSSFLTVRKVAGDSAPTILDISTDHDGDPLKIGNQLNFTVTLSEDAAAGGSATLTLSNGRTVTVDVQGSGNSQFLEGTYIVESGDNDATATDTLEVAGFSTGSVVDLSATGQGVVSGNTFNDLGDILVDANAPTAKITGTDVNSHTYATSTGKLVLQGEGLSTIVADASRDVTTVVDWSKLKWYVDGLTTDTHTFSESDVSSAKVNADGTQLAITLSDAGQQALLQLDGFGGTTATGGKADALSVGVGFLRDAAGNLSTENSTALSTVTLNDTQAPELSEIDLSGAFTSSQGVGRTRGDAFIVGDTLTFTATISDLNELQDNSDMQVKLTLSNDKVLTLIRPDGATGADKVFSADYIIANGDKDAADLTVKSYAIQNVIDISGNPASNAKSLELITSTYSGMATDGGVAVDANAPNAKLTGSDANPHTYDVATGELVLQGESLDTVVIDTVTRDIIDTVDWTKLQWNIDGNDQTMLAFDPLVHIESAKVNEAGTTLTVTLTPEGKKTLHELNEFGGTSASGGSEDSINVAAGLLRDGAGNLSSATSTATSVVKLLDEEAPQVDEIEVFGEFTSTQVSGRTAGAAFIAGDTLTYKVTLTDAIDLQDAENMAVKLTLTNNEVLTLVRPANAAGSDKVFSASYVIAAGDADSSDLKVKSYTVENVTDLAGNVADNSKNIAEITKSFAGVTQDGTPIVVDASAPTAKILGTEALPHTYDAATGVLTLQGESLRTVLTTGDSVKEIVDWSELTWNVNGTGSTTLTLAKVDVDTADVNSDGDTLTITFTSDGKAKLHALGGFGGVEATGGLADALNVGAGFLRDAAGNVSTEVSTAKSGISLTDQIAPVLSSVVMDPVVSSETWVGVGDTIAFKALFTDADSVLADDAEMVLSLNNGASVTLTKSTQTGEDMYLVGSLAIEADKNLDTLFDGGYDALDVSNVDVSDVRDDAGNLAADENLLATVNLGDMKVDTIAPTLQQALYNSTTQEMVFLFDEILSTDAITSLKTAINAVEDLTGAVESGTTNTKITAAFGGSDAPTAGEIIPFTVTFDDVAGNDTTITEIEIGIIG